MREEPRRHKSLILLAGLAVGGLTLVAWTQPWFTVTLEADGLADGTVQIGGEVAAGSLAALGLAGLALVGALSIAGPVFRAILGVLQALIGVTVGLTAVLAILDPIVSSAPAVTEVTGVSGAESVRALVAGVSIAAWPWISVALGVAGVTIGVLIVVTGRRWPGSTRKYQAVRFEPEAGTSVPSVTAEPDPVADWDALSDGSDPTSR